MVVDVGNVLRLQLVAVVVDLVLDVEGAVHVVRLLAATHQAVHLGQRLVGQPHHLVDVLILALGEVVLLAVVLAVDGACHVVAGVADRLEFGDLAQHGANLGLRVVREVGVADGVEVLGNLELHVVADTLVLLNARVELVELRLVATLLLGALTARQGQQLRDHAEHTLHTV